MVQIGTAHLIHDMPKQILINAVTHFVELGHARANDLGPYDEYLLLLEDKDLLEADVVVKLVLAQEFLLVHGVYLDEAILPNDGHVSVLVFAVIFLHEDNLTPVVQGLCLSGDGDFELLELDEYHWVVFVQILEIRAVLNLKDLELPVII